MFMRAKRGLQSITAKSKDATDQEKKVAKNVTSSLALSLQELSVNFRKSQSGYLKRTSVGGVTCYNHSYILELQHSLASGRSDRNYWEFTSKT